MTDQAEAPIATLRMCMLRCCACAVPIAYLQAEIACPVLHCPACADLALSVANAYGVYGVNLRHESSLRASTRHYGASETGLGKLAPINRKFVTED